MTSVTQLEYQDFPLDSFLDDYPVELEEIIHLRRPTLLLSQVISIDRSVVERLEQLGIYDSDDLHHALQQANDLPLRSLDLDLLAEQVQKAQDRRIQLPQLILDLPSNYAILSVQSFSGINQLGLYWRGLSLKFSCSADEYWNPIKSRVEKVMKQMQYPELVGRMQLDSIPHWLEEVVPLSTYISHLPFDTSLVDTALSWGLSTQLLDLENTLDQDLLAQLYLLKLATSLSV